MSLKRTCEKQFVQLIKCSLPKIQKILCHELQRFKTIKPVEEKRRRKEVILPLTLSRMFHLFMNHGGRNSVTVTGKRRNKGAGLEIPETYTFFPAQETFKDIQTKGTMKGQGG